jgi:predicted dienelactone hydrolase
MKNYIKLPKPIGDYVVGITHTEFTYIDADQEKREIPVTIFYPADGKEGKKSHPYGFPELFSGPDSNEKMYKAKTHCYADVQVSNRQTDFPVLIYNQGLGMYEMQNTVLCSDLASCGYIVASVGHPGESSALKYQDGRIVRIYPKYLESMSNPELFKSINPLFEEFKITPEDQDDTLVEMGRQFFALQPFNVRVKVWVMDTVKTADHLEKLNSGEIPSLFHGILRLAIGIGLTGHSFGGSTAIQALHDDPRFVCGINMDGGNFGDYYGEDIKKPLVMIGNPLIWKMLKAVFLSNSADSYHVTVGNSDHMGFTDFLFLIKQRDENSRLGSRDPNELRELITSYQKRFFDRYLLHQNTNLRELNFEDTRFYEKLAKTN